MNKTEVRSTQKALMLKPSVHRVLKEYCNSNGLKMGQFVEVIIMKYLNGDFIDVAQRRNPNPNLFPETEEENIAV